MCDSVNEKERILRIAFDNLAEEYPKGLYDFLYTHDRSAYEEINRLEDQINENFLKGGSVSDLKAVLREYWVIHMKAISSFGKCGNHENGFNNIRTERIQELETIHKL